MNKVAAIGLATIICFTGCATAQAPSASKEQAEVDSSAEHQIWMNEHPTETVLLALPLVPIVLLVGPFLHRDVCQYDAAGHTVVYSPKTLLPTPCKQFAEQQAAQAAEREKEAKEEAERERAETALAAERERKEEQRERAEAERERKEAVEALLRKSPVQSEQNFVRDLQFVNQLHSDQEEALRDANNHVVLTINEEQALRSISLDQWHAISQLATFYKWLDAKSQEAQAPAERQQEQVEREQERARQAAYQWLMADAAARQAAAAEWQAAALWWRQQQCLRRLMAGLRCY